mgnify:CR=1 FL=1
MPDRNIKITLQYDGSRYDGWQKQGNTDKTIQGKLDGRGARFRTDRCRGPRMGTGGEFPSSGVLCRDERGGVESVPEPLSPG